MYFLGVGIGPLRFSPDCWSNGLHPQAKPGKLLETSRVAEDEEKKKGADHAGIHVRFAKWRCEKTIGNQTWEKPHSTLKRDH